MNKSIKYLLGERLAILYLLGLTNGLLIGFVAPHITKIVNYWVYLAICLIMTITAIKFGEWYLIKKIVPLIKKLEKGEGK